MGSRGSEVLEGIRWLIVDSDHAAAAAIARELSLMGCHARLVDAVGLELSQLSVYDAHVVLVDETQDIRFLHERMEQHAGLRYAGVLRFSFAELWQKGAHKPDLSVLAEKVKSLLEPDVTLRARACGSENHFDTHTDAIGIIRCLRAIISGNDVFRVTLRTERCEAHIELAGHLVLGAWYESEGEPALMGEAALASAIELTDAAISVRRKVRPETPWLVLPLDAALEHALWVVRDRRVLEHDDSPTLRIPSPLMQAQVADADAETELEDDAEADVPLTRAVPTVSIPAPPRAPSRFLGVAVFAALMVAGLLVVGMRRKQPLSRVDAEPAALAAPVRTGAVRATETPTASQPKLPSSVPELRNEAANEAQAELASAPLPTPATATNAREVAAQATQALAAGDLDAAERWARRAIQLRPRKLQYEVLLGDVLAESGRMAEALAQYENALSKRPSSRTVKQRISRLKEREGSAPAANRH